MPGWTWHTLLLVIPLLVSATPALSLDYSLIWYTVDGAGGGQLQGSGFGMSATVGQFDAGRMSGGGYTLQLGSSGSGPLPTAVDPSRPAPRFRFQLHPNTPNPFNPATRISFELPSDSKVTLEIYSARGQLIRTLVDSFMPAGMHHMEWYGNDDRGHQLASGVYFAELRAGGSTARQKLTLLK